MKNVLTYRNETIMLLANVDDGTNRLFINDEEIPSSQWVGTGNYTKTIDGVTISITKIANLSGNIVLKKVTDTSFRLVKKAEALQQSYIGMITTSTTLDTLEKVREVFGSDTTWIQHSGYMLRGAANGVVANSAAKTGGADSKIIAKTNLPNYNLTITDPGHAHSMQTDYGPTGSGWYWSGWVAGNKKTVSSMFSAKTGITVSSGGSGAALDVTNQYKSVYIWERTA